MGFHISKHASEQMIARGIDENTVWDILNHPQQIIQLTDKQIYQSVINENDKKYLIRIFVNNLKDPNLVITVYKTSKVEKYYESDL